MGSSKAEVSVAGISVAGVIAFFQPNRKSMNVAMSKMFPMVVPTKGMILNTAATAPMMAAMKRRLMPSLPGKVSDFFREL